MQISIAHRNRTSRPLRFATGMLRKANDQDDQRAMETVVETTIPSASLQGPPSAGTAFAIHETETIMQSEQSHLRTTVIVPVIRALHRARIPILTVALTYILSVSLGIVMVHTRNERAIAYRDRIVSRAQSSLTLLALGQNDRLRAAVLDFGGNLYGAIVDTLGGLGVLVPYPIIAYRGWIGGIVSIDGSHVSRLADAKEGLYYLTTLILQLIPYALAGGAGVNMGLANLKPRSFYQGEKWLGIPREAIRDTVRIYAIVVPFFLVASLWEFFQR